MLKILRGGEIPTDYGTYQLNMPTTDQTGYQSFICHDLSEIVGPFDKHGLDEVNSELRAAMEYSTLNASTLPYHVGGSRVHLLLSMHAQVLPVHLFTLPLGISVYRSHFTDIFGFNICYGGTHESSKKYATHLGASHTVHFMSVISQEQTCMQSVTNLFLDVFDQGYVVSDDIGDCYNTLDLSGGTFPLSSSAHRAMVPFAKLRDLVAPDDGNAFILEDHAKDPCP